jgi:hypothetical protein
MRMRCLGDCCRTGTDESNQAEFGQKRSPWPLHLGVCLHPVNGHQPYRSDVCTGALLKDGSIVPGKLIAFQDRARRNPYAGDI